MVRDAPRAPGEPVMTSTHPCFGCHVPIPDTPGNAYCPECIAAQVAEQGDERAAFDAFHRYADRCARPEHTDGR
jgi:cytochrome c551/c552